MPAGKIEFKLSLDKSTSNFAQFIEWYENTHRTTNEETGRKRKGNAKKVIAEFLEISTIGIVRMLFLELLISIK